MNNNKLRLTSVLISILTSAGLLMLTSAAYSGPNTVADADENAFRGLIPKKENPFPRVSRDLVQLQQEYQVYQAQSQAAGKKDPFTPGIKLMRVSSDGYVVIDAIASGDSAALHSELLSQGAVDVSTYGSMVSARVPIDMLQSLNQLESLRFAQPVYAETRVGSVTSQGDVAQASDILRAGPPAVDGTGIVVGVMSDSYDCLGGEAAGIASGDLPAGVVVVMDEAGCVQGSDEGRGMLEIVHDVAPGAGLSFHTAFGGTATFANGITALRTQAPPNDADVIVDDVFYFSEPMFEDGIIAQSAQAAVDAGVAYYSSAGNSAQNSYHAQYNNSGLPGPLGSPAHDFDPGPGISTQQQLFVPFGAGFNLTLQWNQEFGLAVTDVDIWLIGEDMLTVVFASLDNNIASGQPLEIMSFNNTGFDVNLDMVNDTTFYILIDHAAGPKPDVIKYSYSGSGVSIITFDTNSGTSYGHASAPGAMSVGAAHYVDTPAFGQNPPLRESFSSRGGVPTFFESPLINPPKLRTKPNFTAPDGGSTTFFGQPDTDNPPDGFPNFFGTSAAAPHAAGVAALMLHGDNTLTPAEINSALMNTAIDMSPDFDIDSGFGLIQADDAVAALGNTPPVLDPITSAAAVTGDPPLVFNLNANDADGDNITLTQLEMPGFCNLTDNGDGTGDITCTVTAPDSGRNPIYVTATDDGTPPRAHTQGFYVDANRNVAPVYAMNGAQVMNDNENLNIPLSTVDPDGNTLAYTFPNMPSFCVPTDNGDGTGDIDCNPGYDNTGIYLVSAVAVDNGVPNLNDGETVLLTVNNVNRPPVLDPIGPQDIDEGVTDMLTLTASDPDNTDTLAYDIVNLPSFCGYVDNGDGTADVTCSPSFDDAGVYPNIDVTVTDDGVGGALSDFESVTLTVNDINQAPTLDFIGNHAFANNAVNYVINIEATDPEGDIVTLSNALPVFCVSNYIAGTTATGTITCNPGGAGDNGTNSVTVTATDDGVGNLFTQETFDIVVGDAGAINNFPVLTPIGNQVVNTGNQLVIPLTASDADGGQALNFQQLDMPGFCVLTDNGDRTGDITCNPVLGDQGAYPMWARVFDDGVPTPPILADSEKFTITVVHNNQTPTADAGPDQEVLPLTLVNLDGSNSSDLETAMLQFAWTFLSVPAGSAVTDMSISDPTTATPSFVPDIDGAYVLELTVTDEGLASDTDSVRIYANTASDLYFGDTLNARISKRILPAGTDPGGVGSKGVTLAGFVIETGVVALATHPFTNVMYAVLDVQGQAGHQLVTIDPTAASPIAATNIGNLGEQIVSLSFDAAGKLYGVSWNGSATTDTLFRIDPNTAGLTTVLALPVSNHFAGFGQAIAFKTDTNTLYHAYGGGGGFTPMLETVDIVAGTTTPIAYSGDVTAVFDIDAIAYDRVQDRFVGSMSNYSVPAAEFFALSPAGAVTTVTTPLSSFAWQGATFFDPVFEPPVFARGDSSGDLKADILWRESVTGQNWMYLMDGTIDTTAPINVVSNLDWRIVGRGDYNGDGKADMLWRNIVTGQNWMYLMDGLTILCSVPVNVVGNLDWVVFGNGDYNGDGRSDILWRNIVTGELWMYLMDGDIITSSVSVSSVSNLNWVIVGGGDFNNDGMSDVLWRNTVTGQVWIWLMNGATIMTTQGVGTVGNLNWVIAGTGDFNGDGNNDILWRNTVTGQVWMWLMMANGVDVATSVAVNTVGNLNWVISAIGDYNCDGKADIMWREVSTGQNWLYLMNGNMIANSSLLNWVGNLNWEVFDPF